MKKLLFLLILVNFVASCGETIEEKAAREARQYTKNYCPTPVFNCTRTDSVGFDLSRRTYLYYCSFLGEMDNVTLVDENRQMLIHGLRQSLSTNTGLRPYVEAGISFEYIVRSASHPETILFHEVIEF